MNSLHFAPFGRCYAEDGGSYRVLVRTRYSRKNGKQLGFMREAWSCDLTMKA